MAGQMLPEPTQDDIDTAMRALWPERDPGRRTGDILSTEESGQLGAVAMAIAREREGAVYDFLQWLAVKHLAVYPESTSIPGEAQPGPLLEEWLAWRAD